MAQLVKFEIENTVDPLTGNYNRSDLKRVDSDIANIFKGAKSSISKNDFISTRNKVIDESTGKMITEIITEAKNALNVSSAINSKISEISIRAGRNNPLYALTNTQGISIGSVSGKKTLHTAEAVRLARTNLESYGGILKHTPTVKNPDKYTYTVPFEQVGNKDAEKALKSNIFHEANTLSNVYIRRNNKKAKQREEAKQLETQSKAEMQSNVAQAKQLAKQKADEEKARKEAEKLLAKLETQSKAEMQSNVAQAKQLAKQKADEEKARKEAEKLLAKLEKETEAEQKAKQREKEREQKKREKAYSPHRIFSVISKILGVLTIGFDIVRRILSLVTEQGKMAVRTSTIAHNLGTNYQQARQIESAERVSGLETGTITGAMSDVQSMFGNITNIDEGALETLALIMGSKIEDLVQSGIGGSNPEVLVGEIIDAWNERASTGYNSVGEYVGEAQARRELYSLLNTVSPQLASIFALMQEQRTDEASLYKDLASGKFSDWVNGLSNVNRYPVNTIGEGLLKEVSQYANNVNDLIEQLKHGIAITFAEPAIAVLRSISNIRWGMTGKNNLDLDIKNLEANSAWKEHAQAMLESLPSERGSMSANDWLSVETQRKYYNKQIENVEKQEEQRKKGKHVQDVSKTKLEEQGELGKNLAVAKKAIKAMVEQKPNLGKNLINRYLTGLGLTSDEVVSSGYLIEDILLADEYLRTHSPTYTEDINKEYEKNLNKLNTKSETKLLKSKQKEIDKEYDSDFNEALAKTSSEVLKKKPVLKRPTHIATSEGLNNQLEIMQELEKQGLVSGVKIVRCGNMELPTVTYTKNIPQASLTSEEKEEISTSNAKVIMKQILENLNNELLTYLNEQVYKETEQVGQNLNTFTVLDLVKSDKLSNMLIADLLKGEYSVIGSNVKDSGGENVYRLAIDINKDGKIQDTEEIMLSTGRGFYGKEGNLGTVTIEGTEITWQGVTASTR